MLVVRDPVEEHCSLICRAYPGDGVEQRRLPGATTPDDGRQLARLDREVDRVENLLSVADALAEPTHLHSNAMLGFDFGRRLAPRPARPESRVQGRMSLAQRAQLAGIEHPEGQRRLRACLGTVCGPRPQDRVPTCVARPKLLGLRAAFRSP
jgi:hypothetical protein